MLEMSSKFIEILDTKDSPLRMSASDVRLEDVLADQEAIVSRPRSSTQSSFKDKDRLDRDDRSPAHQRWKRLSNILVATRRPSS